MYKFDKILVGLDQSDIDEELIQAASQMCDQSGSKDVYFMNLVRDFDMPEEFLQQFPDLLKKALKEREENIQAAVAKHFTNKKAQTHVIVKMGQATKEIMKFSAEEKVDLVIVGRKNEKETGDIFTGRLARRASCSLLVIPKGYSCKLNRIFVPTDFSDYSKIALEKAVEIACDTSELIIQNVYQVPNGYHYTGKSYDEFSEIMKEHAAKDCAKFLKGVSLRDLKTRTIFTLDKDDDLIGYIYREAKKQLSNLIVIGAKGRTAATALFIGSKAEKLIQIDADIPLLVARPKGKTAGIMEYLQDL